MRGGGGARDSFDDRHVEGIVPFEGTSTCLLLRESIAKIDNDRDIEKRGRVREGAAEGGGGEAEGVF